VIISPKGFHGLAAKYKKYRFKFVTTTIASFVLMLVAGSQSEQGEFFTWLYFISAIVATQCFFISGFLFVFAKLDSNNSIYPIWHKVALIKEWFYVVGFIVLLAMPAYMLLSLLINGVAAT
jgi:hypothetical protein